MTRTGRIAAAALALVGAGDRKSTRLNSSHSQISYAVFCLKKKKHKAIRVREWVVEAQRVPLQFRRSSESPRVHPTESSRYCARSHTHTRRMTRARVCTTLM